MPRSERLELRLTNAEKAVWDAAAVQAGVPLSEYVRARVNEGIAGPTGRPSEATAVPLAPVVQAGPPAPALPTVAQAGRNEGPVRIRYSFQLCPPCERLGVATCGLCLDRAKSCDLCKQFQQ